VRRSADRSGGHTPGADDDDAKQFALNGFNGTFDAPPPHAAAASTVANSEEDTMFAYFIVCSGSLSYE